MPARVIISKTCARHKAKVPQMLVEWTMCERFLGNYKGLLVLDNPGNCPFPGAGRALLGYEFLDRN